MPIGGFHQVLLILSSESRNESRIGCLAVIVCRCHGPWSECMWDYRSLAKVEGGY